MRISPAACDQDRQLFGDGLAPPTPDRAVQTPCYLFDSGTLSLRQIDDIVAFFRQRTLPLAIMHCVGIYPVPRQHLQLDQIRQLRNRYPELVIGYSAHESASDPDAVALAVANGAALLERHVGLATETITRNSYSLGPVEAAAWVACALSAHTALSPGQPRIQHEAERSSLDELKRGIYTRVDKTPGDFLQPDDLILTMPCLPGQFSAAEVDEVIGLPVPHQGIRPMMPVMKNGNGDVPPEVQVSSIVERVRRMLAEAKVVLPERTSMEISHPKGLKHFDQEGAVLIDVVNREYCKKIIVQLPGQNHPSHKHIQKEETFHLLAGELEIDVDDHVTVLKAGDSLTIQRGKMHGFRTPTGMILEEISTTSIKGDLSTRTEIFPPIPPHVKRLPFCEAVHRREASPQSRKAPLPGRPINSGDAGKRLRYLRTVP